MEGISINAFIQSMPTDLQKSSLSLLDQEVIEEQSRIHAYTLTFM